MFALTAVDKRLSGHDKFSRDPLAHDDHHYHVGLSSNFGGSQRKLSSNSGLHDPLLASQQSHNSNEDGGEGFIRKGKGGGYAALPNPEEENFVERSASKDLTVRRDRYYDELVKEAKAEGEKRRRKASTNSFFVPNGVLAQSTSLDDLPLNVKVGINEGDPVAYQRANEFLSISREPSQTPGLMFDPNRETSQNNRTQNKKTQRKQL